MKLRIHAGSALPSSVCTLMHDSDDTVGSEYCCKVKCSALRSSDCAVDRVSVVQCPEIDDASIHFFELQ